MIGQRTKRSSRVSTIFYIRDRGSGSAEILRDLSLHGKLSEFLGNPLEVFFCLKGAQYADKSICEPREE